MNATREQWRPIPGFNGHYEASDLGRVRSTDRIIAFRGGGQRLLRGKPLRAAMDRYGYEHVVIYRDKRPISAKVHRLVLETFVGPRPDGMECCHKDGDPANNTLRNLRWGSHSSNVRDTIAHGNHNHANSPRCVRGHLLTGANLGQKRPAGRRCRTCASAREYSKRHGTEMDEACRIYYPKYLPDCP